MFVAQRWREIIVTLTLTGRDAYKKKSSFPFLLTIAKKKYPPTRTEFRFRLKCHASSLLERRPQLVVLQTAWSE